jgi:hypothetical protein
MRLSATTATKSLTTKTLIVAKGDVDDDDCFYTNASKSKGI